MGFFNIQNTICFQIESSDDCSRYDYVKVRDDQDFFGTFCGDSIPRNIISADNKLYVKFKSDDSGTDEKGFSATIMSQSM